MLSREEIQERFMDFLEMDSPTVSELLTFAEFCIVEAAARQAVDVRNVRQILEAILDEQGVSRG